jgi:hypothetical protein
MVDETLITTVTPGDGAAVSPPIPPEAAESPHVAELNALQQEVAELKKSLTQLAQSPANSLEQLRQELQTATGQRDQIRNELEQLQRSNQLTQLARTCGFNDVEYLDFLLQKNQIDITDTEAADQFIQQFKTANPRYFSLPVKPGSGSRPNGNRVSAVTGSGNRMSALESMLADAPEIY